MLTRAQHLARTLRNHMTKLNCTGAISRSIDRTSDWRSGLANRYPNDPRNHQAATSLKRMARPGSEITDRQWDRLRPFYDPLRQRWLDALTRTSREVGFRTHPLSFHEYVEGLIGVLEGQA